MSQSQFVQCPDCSFISSSQGHLGIHRSKMHKCSVPETINSVNIVRLFPEGKPYYCCLCHNTIASFPNFKRHFSTTHNGITLKVSAKCVICDREFSTPTGAGVHIQRTHKIGKDDPYPHSPEPVRSYVDNPSSPLVSSVRSRSSRTISIVNSPLSGITTRPFQCSTAISDDPDKSESGYVHPVSSTPNNDPSPVLAEIEPGYEDDFSPSSPPRPCSSSSIVTGPVSESLVALVGCTDLNVEAPPFIPSTPLPPTPMTPLAAVPPSDIINPGESFPSPVMLTPHIPSPDCQPSPVTTVAFSGCTDVRTPISPVLSSPSLTPAICSGMANHQSPLHSSLPTLTPHPSSVTPPFTNPSFSPSSDQNDDIPFNPNPDVENVPEFVTEWSSKLSSAVDFDSFCRVCEDLASAVLERGKSMSNRSSGSRGPPRPASHRPNRCDPHPRRARIHNNPREARRIQTLFRLSKKRAARQILRENNVVYTGSKDQAHHHFSASFAAKHVNIDEVLESLREHVPSTNVDPNLMTPFTNKEIKAKLVSMSNSAPGSDRVEYRHLKLVDPDGSLLQVLFNRCLVERKIPLIWKHATTILIYKKGDCNDPSNFRPIALMSCIYKLFSSLLAMRVTSFAITNDLMSAEQKCARPAEGCHEHTFTLQSIVADCKRNQKNCFLAWLDLKNAFGSISHEVIYTTLSHMGFPSSLIDLIKDIYTNASTTVKTSKLDETDSIPIHAGVKQGCPISPILFNLSSELLIRTVKSKCVENSTIPFQLHGQPISVLAYADDLVLVSRTRQGLQELLNVVSKAADVLSLVFRPEKCASISLTCAKRETSRVSPFVFQVQGHDVPCLAKEESYRYLGVPIGLIYDADDMNSITERLIKDLEKLRDSLLAPWQKLDAIRTFIQPGLTYALRACPVTRESLSTYRSKLIQVLRAVCRLPNRSSVSYFFASKSVGGLGLQDPFDERHVQKIVHTVKILSSADPLIHQIASGQLKSVVYRCIHRNPSDDEIDNFLSGSNEGGLNNHSSANNSQTLWSCCRISAKALHVSFSNALTDPSVSVNDTSSSKAKSVAAYLHRACLEKHSVILKSLPDQGKVARCLQSSQFPSTNNWSYDGTGIRFCDWRFIHRARTNTLPTNDVKSRFSGGHSPTCRKCQNLGDNETLPHIVCHCPPNMPSITRRHNVILERLSKSIHRGSFTVDKVVPGAPGNNRPDLVITDGSKVTIIDVTCPFDNGHDALCEAAQRKVDKYRYLVDHFRSLGMSAKVFGFVVGALGSWYPGNEKALDEIYMSRRYRTLFRKLCCADAIKVSRNIYVEHLSGVPQY